MDRNKICDIIMCYIYLLNYCITYLVTDGNDSKTWIYGGCCYALKDN